MPIAKIERGNIHYTITGNGSPVVMLLPQSGGPAGPEPFLNMLATFFTVICYDQRGTGRSAPALTSDAFTMEERALEVVGLLDSLGIARAHLFCHSTGCGIGLAMVSANSERVDRLILAAPWTHADKHLTTMQQLRIAAAHALDPYHYACFNASLLFPPTYRRTYEADFERIASETKTAPHDAEQISNRLNAILSFDARPLTSAIGCPTLIVSAEDDQLMPAWFGRELARNISGSKLLELTGGGHMIPETRAGELASAVLEFLDRHEPV
jgi:pimeloyl-ACP methyl ester carboxylesterase